MYHIENRCVYVHTHICARLGQGVSICMPYFGNFGKIGYLEILFSWGPKGVQKNIWRFGIDIKIHSIPRLTLTTRQWWNKDCIHSAHGFAFLNPVWLQYPTHSQEEPWTGVQNNSLEPLFYPQSYTSLSFHVRSSVNTLQWLRFQIRERDCRFWILPFSSTSNVALRIQQLKSSF